MKRFLLVSFLDDDKAVAVVPSVWIVNEIEMLCVWPPYKNPDRIKKACKNLEEVQLSWIEYRVTVLYASDDYDECHKKLPESQFHSDLGTDAEASGLNNKRTIIKRKRSSSLSFSDEENYSNLIPVPPTFPDPHPRSEEARHSGSGTAQKPAQVRKPLSGVQPPSTETLRKKKKIEQRGPSNGTTPSFSKSVIHKSVQGRPLFSPQPPTSTALFSESREESFQRPMHERFLSSSQPSTSYAASTGSRAESFQRENGLRPPGSYRSTPTYSESREGAFQRENEIRAPGSYRTTPTYSESREGAFRRESELRAPGGYRSTPTCSESRGEVYQGKVLTLLETLVNGVKDIQHRLDRLEASQLAASDSRPATLPPGCPELPIHVVGVLAEFNDFLKEKKKFDDVCVLLATTGGYTARDGAKRILQKILSNPLSLLFNWKGSRGAKLAFSQFTQIVKLICDAVRLQPVFSSATEVEILDYIKKWLMHSGDRDGGRTFRRQQRDDFES